MNRRQVASLTVAVVGLYAIATAVAELRLRPNDWVWYWYFTMDTLRAVPALVWGLVLWLMHRRLSHWLSHCRGPEEEETPRQFGSALTCQAFGLWLFTELVRELPGRVSFAVHRLDVATSAGLIGSLMLAAIASVLTFAPGRMTLFLNRHDRDEVPTTTYLVAQVLGLAGLGVILLCLRDFVFAGLVLSVSWGNVIVTIAGIAFGIRLVCGRRRWAERWLGRNQ